MQHIHHNVSNPLKLYNHLLAIFAVLFFFSEIGTYAYSILKISPLSKKNWTFIFLAAAILLLVLDKKNISRNLNRPIFKWLLGFSIVSLIWSWDSVLFGFKFGEKGLLQLEGHLFTLMSLFSFSVIFYRFSAFEWAIKTAVIVVLFSVIVNIYDFFTFNEHIFSHIKGRAAGMYRNPNNSGIALIFGFLLTIQLIPNKWKSTYTALVFLGVLLTQSRGGIIVFVFILTLFLIKKVFTPQSMVILASILLLTGVGAGVKVYDQIKVNYLSKLHSPEQVFARYQQLVSMNTEQIGKDSRINIAQYYLSLWSSKPVLGYGVGGAYSKEASYEKISSHNQFINWMIDFGIVGIVLLLLFILSIVTFDNRILGYFESYLFILVFILFAFTSHNLFDYLSFLIAYSLFGRWFQYKYERKEAGAHLKLI